MLYEVLKTAKIGAGKAPDLYTALMAQKMPFAKGSGTVHEYTGLCPYSFIGNGTPLLDWYIKGNMEQSGTPTPSNPIYPQECGDLETSGIKAGQYKIPISCGGTTTNIYLGEVQSTRKIKKYEFTGDENWHIEGSDIFYSDIMNDAYRTIPICSHFKGVASLANNNDITISQTLRINIKTDYITHTVNDFKTYLQQQYSNGTPVTVWYVLATPTTGIVNEPIRKIGDYADTVSMEQTGIEIPTVRGANTLDVLTDVKPSKVYIKYKGG